jgi:hypothetical protein
MPSQARMLLVPLLVLLALPSSAAGQQPPPGAGEGGSSTLPPFAPWTARWPRFEGFRMEGSTRAFT